MSKTTLPSEGPTSSRADNSLFILTRRFLQLLLESPNRKIDLKLAAQKLNVHKRRLYDITNILEGLNLLRKSSTNIAQWMGDDLKLILDTDECVKENELQKNEDTMKMLGDKEFTLSRTIESLNGELNEIVMDKGNSKLLYVNFKDLSLLECLRNKTAFAVKAPQDASFEINEESKGHFLQMNTLEGRIDVFYIEDKKDD